jgi:two-component system chemotaxis response regulator CheY
MDITMPVMDGITATREIRTLDPAARVVMVSALGQQTMVIEAIKAGAKDFVVKPFEPDKILATVKKFLG